MRKITRTLASLLAVMLLLGTMTVTAMATTTQATGAITKTGSVKITNAVAGVTYKLYRIFDISGVTDDETKVALITNEKWDAVVRGLNLNFGTIADEGVGSAVTVTNGDLKPENSQDLASKVADAADNGLIAPDATATVTESGVQTIDDLQFGFYVMVSGREGSTLYTVFTVKSETTPLEITEKNTKEPSIDKKVEGEDAVSADFNKVLNYTITIGAVAGTDTYTVTDTLPDEITLNADSITLAKIDRNGTTTPLTENTDYTVTANTAALPHDFTLELTAAARAALTDSDKLVISYTGTLQPNTNTVRSYTNTATLSYGEEPGSQQSADADVFSGHVEFVKKDNLGNYLKDASFVLKNDAGQYAVLTGEVPSLSFSRWTDNENEATSIITKDAANDRDIIIRGLKAGTYTLIETAAPEGYVKGDDTQLVITETKVNEVLTSLSNTKAEVINTKGSTLPDTGGIGTTVFYIAGAVLVVSAAALLVLKRRKHA